MILKKNLQPIFLAVAVLSVLGMILYSQHGNIDRAMLEATLMDEKINAPNSDSTPEFTKLITQDNANGGVRHVFTNNVQKPEVDNTLLVVALIANAKSFGKDRTWKDFMDVIGSLDYAKDDISLAFFCGTNELFDEVDTYAEKLFASKSPYRKLTLLKADFLHSEFGASNHEAKVQRQRRRLIARARNYAVLNSLDSEQYTLFMDADIVQLTHTDMVKRFVASGKDILVPRIEKGGNRDYDKNSWRGTRVIPSVDKQKLMDENKWDEANFEPHDVADKMYHLGNTGDLTPNSPELSLDYLVPLDSVGGAILFAKSIIYKQGILFPPIYIVGTTWQRHEGYDGIETEGLCYIARPVGYLCWGMPNLVAKHTEHHAV